MSRTKALREDIESIQSDAEWRLMGLEELEERFVTEMADMSEERLAKIVMRLKPGAFDKFRRKLWDAQDIEPDPNDQYASFDRSMPVMTLLKRCLLIRMMTEEDERAVSALNQQLTMLSLMMDPEAIAELTGMPLDDNDIEEDDYEDEDEDSDEDMESDESDE